jgi:hypothetical protein
MDSDCQIPIHTWSALPWCNYYDKKFQLDYPSLVQFSSSHMQNYESLMTQKKKVENGKNSVILNSKKNEMCKSSYKTKRT